LPFLRGFHKRPRAGERLEKLARRIESASQQDEERLVKVREAERLRSRAALELHSLCAALVEAVNGLLTKPAVELSPPDYSEASFRETGANVFQINVSGRMVHLEFQATETLSSTERFRIPYILEGAVRAFNQELLDLAVVPEQLLFCCPGRGRLDWLWFDPRTQHSGPLDQDRLITLFEQLL